MAKPIAQRHPHVSYSSCGLDCHRVELRNFTAAQLALIGLAIGGIIWAARR